MPCDLAARIVRHEALNPDHFLLTLECPSIARASRPGQFVMLQVREGHDPLLRRPMSVFRLPPGAARAAVPPSRPVLVAGGIGIAIFPFLLEALPPRGPRPILLFGARTARDLVALDAFRRRGTLLRLATEDG